MSRAAIAAALALDDVAGGERLVAFALASFANREQLAWPGTPSAAARAGLARSRYLDARSRLLSRGLIETHERGGGRGRSTTVLLRFAEGTRFDGDVNAELFETVLCYSRASGPARLLLASIAALADEHGELDGVTANELCAAAGLAKRTYRRARNALIASGELELVCGVGGRGHSNHWRIPDLHVLSPGGARRPRRQPPSALARPLMAATTPPAHAEAAEPGEVTPSNTASDGITTVVKGGHDRTVSPVKGGQDRTVSALKGGQDRTVYQEAERERGTQRGPERGPPNARAWKEPGNQGTSEHPPNPPEGGLSTGELFVEQSYVTEHGRKRKRLVPVDVEAVRLELKPPSCAELEPWRAARALMLGIVGESTFEIWLDPLELVAVARDGSLVLAAPDATSNWVQKRFGRVIAHCCEQSGREVRFASAQERAAIEHAPELGSRALVRDQPTMNRRVS